MIRTRVKICGITRVVDGVTAAEVGADALGFVFFEKSPRYVSIECAAEICRNIPPFVTKVGLFVDASEEMVRDVIENVNIDLLQFHGDESPEFCQKFNLPYIKAIRAKCKESILEAMQAHSNALGMLIDSYVPGVPGGTGSTFDWQLVPSEYRSKIILAGGLNCANIVDAIKTIRPYAVDISGGVESSKGIKDREKIYQFMKEVASADKIY
ncbi:phosphoribosylanthranilate isomerase [Alkalimarinus alittae]|uniref:N-(5'-phosphoribosyl)anthranilate isomerase n=1 Tax=Alkalimarinus alittae TaxID=2961619 RepID=A0ABY6N754_9ALTE|nr:phosphoribosylanthranilate isomerase [Alkalimarinus alittae]UZE97855.1 phosphoribosylanthranilate isomerase [Alkalimarinus alittae]